MTAKKPSSFTSGRPSPQRLPPRHLIASTSACSKTAATRPAGTPLPLFNHRRLQLCALASASRLISALVALHLAHAAAAKVAFNIEAGALDQRSRPSRPSRTCGRSATPRPSRVTRAPALKGVFAPQDLDRLLSGSDIQVTTTQPGLRPPAARVADQVHAAADGRPDWDR